MLRHSLHGLHAFPNTVINVSIARKSNKGQRIDMMETLVDNDEVVSTWSVHIFKYGN